MISLNFLNILNKSRNTGFPVLKIDLSNHVILGRMKLLQELVFSYKPSIYIFSG